MKNFNLNTKNNEEWITPLSLIESLGVFDLDPCSPIKRPYDTAKKHYNKLNDGLKQKWEGRVWLNPPYGKKTFKWMNKLSQHKNGVALIFSRTETKGFFKEIWNKAYGIFFFERRIAFYNLNGIKGNSANAPSCLVVYDKKNFNSIKNSNLKGKLIKL